MSPRRSWLPWPSRRSRRQNIDAARERFEHAVSTREMTQDLVDALREARERNHFREMFDTALRRTG